MKRTVIPAGSTPSEKERGRWMKLTNDEASWLESLLQVVPAHLTFKLDPPAETHRASIVRKLREFDLDAA